MKRLIPLFVLAGIVALVVALSSGGSKNQSANAHAGGAYGGKSSTAAPAGAAIDVRATALGRTLVDTKGRTLYLFEADKGTKSACDGACASIWPPLVTKGKPTAGAGLTASKLGTTKRADGTTALTYNGHPLYTYAGDTAAGQTSGQGLDDYGAEWYALSARGDKIDNG